MRTKMITQTQAFKIDLTEIDGEGDFICPRCGAYISPDDQTDDTYTIIEARVDGINLAELIICCSKCKSQIHLTGFSALQKIEEVEERILGKETCFYINHI